MVTPPDGAALRSRRALLESSAVGVAGAAALALGACGSGSGQPTVHKIPAQARDAEVEILNRLLDVEYRAIAAYTAAIPLLELHVKSAAKQFLNQELTHAGELYALIRRAGGVGDKSKASYDLGHPRNREEVLQLLHRIEQEQVAGYVQAIPNVSPGSVRAVLASILASDAQHVTVVRLALRLDPLPSALVTGRE